VKWIDPNVGALSTVALALKGLVAPKFARVSGRSGPTWCQRDDRPSELETVLSEKNLSGVQRVIVVLDRLIRQHLGRPP